MEHGGWSSPPLNATWSTVSRRPRQQDQLPPAGCRISSLVVRREKSVRKVFKPLWSFWRPLQVANMALEKESVSDEFGLRDLQAVQLLLLLMFQNWVAFLHISSLDQDEISLCNFHWTICDHPTQNYSNKQKKKKSSHLCSLKGFLVG